MEFERSQEIQEEPDISVEELPKPTIEERMCMDDLRQEVERLKERSEQDVPRKQGNHLKRKIALLNSRLRALENGDFGRRIPDTVSFTVIERDKQRDFGRPNHVCEGVRPPHHIVHFETFKGGQTRENPHTERNLEAPCQDCHKLAHALGVKSGVSIKTFFESFTFDQWKVIENLWAGKRISELKKIIPRT